MQWTQGWASALSRPLDCWLCLGKLLWGECPAWKSLLEKAPEPTLYSLSGWTSFVSCFLL